MSLSTKKKKRGSSNINIYMVVLYKKYSVPVSAFILTIIAVSVLQEKEGRYGMNLTIGIAIAFGYVFFDKIFGTLAEKLFFYIVGSMVSYYFRILAIFFTSQCKTIN
jgi:lipopolysaccharide export system permease protein